MVICKASVRFKRFTPAMLALLHALDAADRNFVDGQPTDLVITSANDATHGPKSRHYTDEAVDVRSKTFPAQTKAVFRAALERALGPKFRVLYEGAGTPNEHFHCQVRRGMAYP